MTFLLGKHAMFGQDPPIYFRSMTAVRRRSLAIVQAINLPAVPLPNTTTSYFSAAFMRFTSLVRLFPELATGVLTARASPQPLQESGQPPDPVPYTSDCDQRGVSAS